MPNATRKRLRLVLAALSGLLCLPPLIFGLYFFVCWVRVHTSDIYYVEYPRLLAALVFVGIGILSICCVVYGVIRRSLFGIAFATPLFLGLATMIYIPDGMPHVQKSMVSDSNYLSNLNLLLRSWYESHQSFPKDDLEFRDAIRNGAKKERHGFHSPSPLSDYAKRGARLRYETVVIQNASGPKLDSPSERPGVIYYSIAADQQRFWLTMTALHADLCRSASLKIVADRPSLGPWLVTAAGKDYPAHH
jgi:hypothetical protein